MKYLLLVCNDPTIDPPDEVGDIDVWFEEIAKRGAWLDGDRLHLFGNQAREPFA